MVIIVVLSVVLGPADAATLVKNANSQGPS